VLKTTLGRLRVVGYLEGISFLTLLGIAMPLKYLANEPKPVLIVGWIHGLLFMLFVAAVIHARIVWHWSPMRTIGALSASILPFGPFVLDIWLRHDDAERSAGDVAGVAPVSMEEVRKPDSF
jgi:integral membrane protein